jgi:hypothetical protein
VKGDEQAHNEESKAAQNEPCSVAAAAERSSQPKCPSGEVSVKTCQALIE